MDENQKTLFFDRERETKRMVRFKERGSQPTIGTLYVNKEFAQQSSVVMVILKRKVQDGEEETS